MSANPKTRTELDFLTSVERGEVVSQLALSTRVGVAVGLINLLLKRAMKKGYVKTRSAPAKRYAYYLTPKGFKEKSRLVAEYMEISLNLFRRARGEFEELFQHAGQCGATRLVLIGAGDLSEIAILAADGTGVSIRAILSRTQNVSHIQGYPIVRSLEEVEAFDAAVLTDMTAPQDTYDRLVRVLEPERILVPGLLRVVRGRRALTNGRAKVAGTVR